MWTGVCRKNPATLGIITQTLHLWCAKHSSSIQCAWNQIQLVFICRMLCISWILAFGEKGIEFAKHPLLCCRAKQDFIFLGFTQWVLSALSQTVSKAETQDAGIWSKHSVILSTQADQSIFSHYEGGRERGIVIHFVGGEEHQCLSEKGGDWCKVFRRC